MKATFQIVPTLELSFPADVHDLLHIQGVVSEVSRNGTTAFRAGTRVLEAGCPAFEPLWCHAVFAYAEAAAHAASAMAEEKAKTLLRESVAEFFGIEEKEEDCAF